MAEKRESNRISREALKVRSEIVVQCKEHCFDLTPEQVQTVIDLYKESSSKGNDNERLYGTFNWGVEKPSFHNGGIFETNHHRVFGGESGKESILPLKDIAKFKMDFDCSNVLKGLKAITREAKNATAALREHNELQNKSVITNVVSVDGKELAKTISNFIDSKDRSRGTR